MPMKPTALNMLMSPLRDLSDMERGWNWGVHPTQQPGMNMHGCMNMTSLELKSDLSSKQQRNDPTLSYCTVSLRTLRRARSYIVIAARSLRSTCQAATSHATQRPFGQRVPAVARPSPVQGNHRRPDPHSLPMSHVHIFRCLPMSWMVTAGWPGPGDIFAHATVTGM